MIDIWLGFAPLQSSARPVRGGSGVVRFRALLALLGLQALRAVDRQDRSLAVSLATWQPPKATLVDLGNAEADSSRKTKENPRKSSILLFLDEKSSRLAARTAETCPQTAARPAGIELRAHSSGQVGAAQDVVVPKADLDTGRGEGPDRAQGRQASRLRQRSVRSRNGHPKRTPRAQEPRSGRPGRNSGFAGEVSGADGPVSRIEPRARHGERSRYGFRSHHHCPVASRHPVA